MSPSERRVRVLHLPGVHSYVQAVTPDTAESVASAVTKDALTPGWLTAHAERIDVVHLHFGFDSATPGELTAWLEELRRLDLALVFTIHDLRNPHHLRPDEHDQHLRLLVPAADALITLTDAAADVVARSWGRRPRVVAHPPVAAPGTVVPRTSSGRTAGVHLKDLRRNVVEPARVVAASAAGALAAGGRLRVDLHPGVAGRPDLAPVHELARRGDIDLVVHERFDDEQHLEYLAALDVSVLPYRFGTHSGWLEGCRDVGTRVVAPSCGFYADQWREVVGYRADEATGLDPRSLTDAVRTALLAPAVLPLSTAERDERLRATRAAHADIYAAVTDSSTRRAA